jgi:hypothetical protein|tara:strand:- start:352 stop:495 length:144 start_codon:yes stop_codon:yes gene_type:complete
MAVKKTIITIDPQKRKNKRTSIGSSRNSYPRNKHKRKQYKKYRGQGR